MTVSEGDVRDRLKTVIDTDRNINVIDADLIAAVSVQEASGGARVVLSVVRTSEAGEPLLKDCRDAVLALDGVVDVATEWHAMAEGSPATTAAEESADDSLSEARVFEELKKVIDPELFVNIVDLGLIYEVTLSDGEADKQDVHIAMTMTSPMCPAGPQMIANSKQVLGQISAVGNVEVKIVLDPPWTPDKMTDDARDQLGIF